MKKIILILLFTIFSATKLVYCQNSTDKLQWSAKNKLTVNDFLLKTKSIERISSFAQFSFDYKIHGFDFLTKNFNKKVFNSVIKTASWIDTTSNFKQSLIYQQTLFDIAEIYTRQFRKALKNNRKQIIKGFEITEELHNKIMTAFSVRRIEYDRETKFSSDLEKQKVWESLIEKELMDLNDFAFEK